MAKKYKYKLWLEVERVEIDANGKEIGEHERGEMFDFEPEKLYECNNFISGIYAKRQDIIDQFGTI